MCLCQFESVVLSLILIYEIYWHHLVSLLHYKWIRLIFLLFRRSKCLRQAESPSLGPVMRVSASASTSSRHLSGRTSQHLSGRTNQRLLGWTSRTSQAGPADASQAGPTAPQSVPLGPDQPALLRPDKPPPPLRPELGLGTEFRSEKIPRNRLGMVSVIPRKKVLIPKH